jgi:hypothetical protein
MKNLSSFLIILICLYLSGCKDSGTQVSGQGSTKYPSRLNNEWEYQTTTTLSYYNKSGGFDSTSEEQPENSIIKIIKTDDSLKNYKGLIKFEIYNKLDPGNKSYDWYLNSDTSFIAIAYYNPAVTQIIQPKRNFAKRYLTLAEIKGMIYSFSPDLRITPKATFGDTVQFYDIPRKVLAYPLSVGNTWVELYYPFYRERYINNYLNIVVEGQQYSCYEIKVNWPNYRTEFNDFISLEGGLIKREIIADSILISTAENPDGIGLGKISTTSTLIRRNF